MNQEILFDMEFANACGRLQKFLLEEFPLEINEGDNLIDAAIRLMKDMKGQLGRHTAAEMVFGNTTRF